MAPVSNACWWRQIASVTLTVPGESQALQRCNLTRDISVDNAPMVLPVPNGPAFIGDSFPKAHWTLEPSLRKPAFWSRRTLRSDNPKS